MSLASLISSYCCDRIVLTPLTEPPIPTKAAAERLRPLGGTHKTHTTGKAGPTTKTTNLRDWLRFSIEPVHFLRAARINSLF